MPKDPLDTDTPQITPRDFVAVLRGTADPQTASLVRNALLQPTSEVHEWVENVEDWAACSLPLRRTDAKAADQMIQEAAATKDRQQAVVFVRKACRSGLLSTDELNRVLAIGARSYNGRAPASASSINESTIKMLSLAIELNPALASGVVSLFRGSSAGPNR